MQQVSLCSNCWLHGWINRWTADGTDAEGRARSDGTILFLISKYAPGVFLSLRLCTALSLPALGILQTLYLLYSLMQFLFIFKGHFLTLLKHIYL